jgi:hypothetical protein
MNNHINLEDLKTDLIYLRRDAGFIPERLYRKADVFLSTIGGKTQDFETIKARLISAIESIPDKQTAKALLMAFALTPEYADMERLTDRREKYGKQINRKIDTIADRENAGIDGLALILLSARYGIAPLPNDAPIIHNAAIHERVEVTTLVRDYLWTETREYYRMVPLIDDAKYLEVSTDLCAKVTAIRDNHAIHNAIAKTESINGGSLHRFWYDKPLQRGKSVELNFSMTPDGLRDDQIILIEETRAFHEPTISCSFEVIFLGHKPRLIWYYCQLPYAERPGKPTKQQLLDLNSGTSVRVDFSNLYGGLWTGVAWEW